MVTQSLLVRSSYKESNKNDDVDSIQDIELMSILYYILRTEIWPDFYCKSNSK